MSIPAFTAARTAGITWAGPRWMASSGVHVDELHLEVHDRFISEGTAPDRLVEALEDQLHGLVRVLDPFVMSRKTFVPSMSLIPLASSFSNPAFCRTVLLSISIMFMETSPFRIAATTAGSRGERSR